MNRIVRTLDETARHLQYLAPVWLATGTTMAVLHPENLMMHDKAIALSFVAMLAANGVRYCTTTSAKARAYAGTSLGFTMAGVAGIESLLTIPVSAYASLMGGMTPTEPEQEATRA